MYFQNNTAYSYKIYSTQYPNLHHYYFTLLPHILYNNISSYTLPLKSLSSLIEATVEPSCTHPVPLPILPPSKITTDDQSYILTTQLYTSVYFLLSNALHMPYLPICFTTQIMKKHAHPFTLIINE